MDLEQLLTRPEGFGLTTATPVQRATCRVIGGRPLGDLATNPDVLPFGGELPPDGFIREIIIRSAIRGAKTLIAAATGVWATQTADLSTLRPGEIPRYTITSTARDQATVCLGHLVKFTEEVLLPFQISQGMVVVGNFVGQEEKDLYVWMRRFEREQERTKLYKKVYESETWLKQIKPEVDKMLIRPKMVVTRLEATA